MMKISPFRVFLAGMIAGGFLATTLLFADSDEQAAAAASEASKNWLAEIDAGQYDKSYAEGCTAFHHKVSTQEWTVVLKALRPGMGTLVNRKEVSHSYKPDGYEGLEGECMIFTYNSAFSKVPTETEVVVMKREDGVWRGAGYNAQAQLGSDQAIDNSGVNAQTDVQESHIQKPQ